GHRWGERAFRWPGAAKPAGAPRVYRRMDVETVVRIKHLLLVEGLPLAGARRRLEEESAPVAPDEPVIDELIGQNARERLTAVKRGLQSILDLLAHANGDGEFRLMAPKASPAQSRARAAVARAKSARGKSSRTARRSR